MSSKHSQALHRRWSDPAYREKQTAVLRANNAAGRRKKEKEPMSEPNDPIEIAQSLVDSLYASGDLSVDQADGITTGLGAGADHRRALNQKDARIATLESQLSQAHEQIGYLGRLVEILRDAAAPAATALFNVEQLPLDDHTRETIRQTLAPLDAALAAVTARSE